MAAFDAVVVGAGPAGGIAAVLLARAGWRVALVEQAAFPRRKVCGEFLSATNLPLFEELGIARAVAMAAGPEIRRMGLYAREATLTAPMPRAACGWGRALGRETLDTLLRDSAVAAGASVLQPWRLVARERLGGVHHCTLSRRGETMQVSAPILIEANGAGERTAAHRPGDLLGFKAHFRGAALAGDLMPLLVFPGGYGGLVTTSESRVTFGCCIRRDVVDAARQGSPGPAAEAVLAYVMRECHGVANVLGGAVLDGPWLGTGPITPGIRPRYADGVFRVGTAAGETHPLVGEGMSMAMQGAWTLARALLTPEAASLDRIGVAYAAAWRRRFAPRIHAAGLFAALAMHRGTISVLLPLLRHAPALLTYGAARSGKTRVIVG